MTTNLWTVGQGLITRRLIPKVAPPAPGPKRSSRTPPKEPPPDGGQPVEAPQPQKPNGGQPRRVKRKKKAQR
jgi:hypothetical protein